MTKPFPRLTSRLPRVLRVLAAPVCAVALVASGAGAALASGPSLPTKDAFYVYTGSKPLSRIAPGTVLKKRAVSVVISSTTVPYTAEQVLYRSTGELGQPIVTVTTIIQPLKSSLGKIVSYQTAYDALGSQCDPSYTLRGGNPGDSTASEEADIIGMYVSEGYTVTVPDYEGSILLDWAAGQSSGYATLDGIRATENYLKLAASTPVGMLGYSGGSIATEWASELAPAYAPKLHIIGAASGGVPVDFAHNLTYINGDDDWSGVIPAVLDTLSRSFGVKDVSHYLSAYGKKITKKVEGECIANFAASYPGLRIQKLLKPQYSNPFDIGFVVRIINHLIMGTAPGHPQEPLLFGVGDADHTGDGIMIAGDVEALAHEYCTQGVPVTFDVYDGLTHTEAAVPFESDAMSFLTSLFAGSPPSNGCSSIGKGNSLKPLPYPHHHKGASFGNPPAPRRVRPMGLLGWLAIALRGIAALLTRA